MQKIHIAITHKPFLDAILQNKKTIETRFTNVRCAPFNKVNEGDKVLLKESGKKISAEYTIEKVEYFINNDKNIFEEIKKYKNEIQSDLVPDFWETRKDKKYITLIWIKDVKKIENSPSFTKKDRRGWVVLENK